MSVTTTPSIEKLFSSSLTAGATNTACWPDSEPPTLIRSESTPGVWVTIAHGSRAVGIFSSSIWDTVVPFETLRSSSSGLSVVTSMTSEMTPPTSSPPAAVRSSGSVVFWPTRMLTALYSSVLKPSSDAVS